MADVIKARHKAAMDEELRTFYDKRKKKQNALQRDCSHLQTYVYVDDSDYHNNISWDETYCKVCGKMLSRI